MGKKTKPNSTPEAEADVANADSDEIRIRRTMILLEDAGILMPVWDFQTVEKVAEMKTSVTGCTEIAFGIAINRGIPQSEYVKRTDITIWYADEGDRDAKFERIREILEINGVSVITL